MNQSNEPGDKSLPWDEILLTAVHDIRTPLSSMLVTLEVLRDLHGGSEPSAKLIAMLDRQVMGVSDLLERLLRDPASFQKPAASD